jgi:hypothetical protein
MKKNKNNDHSEYDKEKDILDPWFITGFSDGDSSFWFSLVPNKKLKTKMYEYRVQDLKICLFVKNIFYLIL